MAYRPDKALERTKAFTLDESAKGALIRCVSFGPVELPPVPALETCTFPRDAKRLMDAVIENHKRWFDAHEKIDDDYLPALKPFLGIAEHSCFLGGEVKYGGNTSYQEPALSDIKRWRELRLDENYPHYKLLMDCMAYLKDKSREYGFFVSLRGFDGPLDIANAIRGNDILYDLYDDEDSTKQFIDFCSRACLWTSEKQRRYADEVEGGYISGMGLWMPGNAIGHISEDMSAFCSPECYETFGLPYTQKVLEHFDYAMLHVHSVGAYCLPLFRRMEKIKIYQLTDDPKQPRAIDVFKQYEACFDGVIVNLDLTAQEVRDNLNFLKRHRSIINLIAHDPDEANAIIDLIRS